ncbi:hypothetical protein [Saccharopolyspora sp. CA-218241]|uniref:hypothetical protein n=1 Tax=Saccharopolyspora sp. CA-218241 TaxID=3240027 RepID=UPI003D99A936
MGQRRFRGPHAATGAVRGAEQPRGQRLDRSADPHPVMGAVGVVEQQVVPGRGALGRGRGELLHRLGVPAPRRARLVALVGDRLQHLVDLPVGVRAELHPFAGGERGGPALPALEQERRALPGRDVVAEPVQVQCGERELAGGGQLAVAQHLQGEFAAERGEGQRGARQRRRIRLARARGEVHPGVRRRGLARGGVPRGRGGVRPHRQDRLGVVLALEEPPAVRVFGAQQGREGAQRGERFARRRFGIRGRLHE